MLIFYLFVNEVSAEHKLYYAGAKIHVPKSIIVHNVELQENLWKSLWWSVEWSLFM